LNRVRCTSPVPVGSELRARIRLKAYDELPDGGVQMTTEVTIERKGSDKPGCGAETIARRYA
jgi:acyl dehydratase